MEKRCKMRIMYPVLRMKNVGLFMGLNDFYEHGIARGLVRYSKERSDWRVYGYGWMFRPLDALQARPHWDLDGIIARVEKPADAGRLAALRIPVVDVAGAFVGAGFHQVTNDDRATGSLAARHLRACGFRRLAFCGVRGAGWSEERKAGFLEAAGLAPREMPAFEEGPLGWWEGLDDPGPLRAWLRALEEPVGIFACNDTAALKLTDQCRELGLAVPEAVAILGVDNEDILCELSSPSLSSVRLDCERIGWLAAATLDRILDRGDGGPFAPLRVPPLEVVERDSTRVFACDDPVVQGAVRFIRARATGRIRVTDVAAAVAVSRRNLEVRFRRALGRTVHEEILRTRLGLSRVLLRTSDRTVARVAEECGFATLQRFHAAFRAAEGLTPARYRRLHPGPA